MITITTLAMTRVRARAVHKTVLLAGILNRTSLYRIKHRHYMSTVALHCIVQATATVTGQTQCDLTVEAFFKGAVAQGFYTGRLVLRTNGH